MALIDNDQILLPNLIDELARLDPERLYCALVKSRNVDDGFRKVTYGEFANAVNRCAWWLEEQVGKSDHFTTLAYVGMMDIRYTIMTLAATKVGYKVREVFHFSLCLVYKNTHFIFRRGFLTACSLGNAHLPCKLDCCTVKAS